MLGGREVNIRAATIRLLMQLINCELRSRYLVGILILGNMHLAKISRSKRCDKMFQCFILRFLEHDAGERHLVGRPSNMRHR